MTYVSQIDHVLDTKGTRCPIPLLRAKQALKAMQVGEYLKVIATDPSVKEDFDLMLSHLPHELVDYQVESISDAGNDGAAVGQSGYKKVYTVIIRKG